MNHHEIDRLYMYHYTRPQNRIELNEIYRRSYNLAFYKCHFSAKRVLAFLHTDSMICAIITNIKIPFAIVYATHNWFHMCQRTEPIYAHGKRIWYPLCKRQNLSHTHTHKLLFGRNLANWLFIYGIPRQHKWNKIK